MEQTSEMSALKQVRDILLRSRVTTQSLFLWYIASIACVQVDFCRIEQTRIYMHHLYRNVCYPCGERVCHQ